MPWFPARLQAFVHCVTVRSAQEREQCTVSLSVHRSASSKISGVLYHCTLCTGARAVQSVVHFIAVRCAQEREQCNELCTVSLYAMHRSASSAISCALHHCTLCTARSASSAISCALYHCTLCTGARAVQSVVHCITVRCAQERERTQRKQKPVQYPTLFAQMLVGSPLNIEEELRPLLQNGIQSASL